MVPAGEYELEMILNPLYPIAARGPFKPSFNHEARRAIECFKRLGVKVDEGTFEDEVDPVLDAHRPMSHNIYGGVIFDSDSPHFDYSGGEHPPIFKHKSDETPHETMTRPASETYRSFCGRINGQVRSLNQQREIENPSFPRRG